MDSMWALNRGRTNAKALTKEQSINNSQKMKDWRESNTSRHAAVCVEPEVI